MPSQVGGVNFRHSNLRRCFGLPAGNSAFTQLLGDPMHCFPRGCILGIQIQHAREVAQTFLRSRNSRQNQQSIDVICILGKHFLSYALSVQQVALQDRLFGSFDLVS
ncbi:MAG TPA: hypothetical protein DDW97_02330 [Anaerolineaceae bacterium]|nr:hypothetical protein [Anaerolineaceae bacterium]